MPQLQSVCQISVTDHVLVKVSHSSRWQQRGTSDTTHSKRCRPVIIMTPQKTCLCLDYFSNRQTGWTFPSLWSTFMHTQSTLVWLTMDCSRPFIEERFYGLSLVSDRWCDVTGFVLACNLSSVSSCSTLLICRDVSHWWRLFCPSIFTENYYCYDPDALVKWHQRAFHTIDLYVTSSPYISSYSFDPA